MKSRYTKQNKQEDRSFSQFSDRMVEFGWVAEKLARDIGEDASVRILTKSNPVGIPFYVQLKSITDTEKHTKKKGLGYRIEIDDLLHW